jgi:hypothetical protein
MILISLEFKVVDQKGLTTLFVEFLIGQTEVSARRNSTNGERIFIGSNVMVI